MLRNLGDGVKIFPLIAVAIGCLLLLSYAVRHFPEYSRSLSIKVEHPETFRFPLYDGLLKKYVKDGLVDYANLKIDPDLKNSVATLEGVAPDKLKDEKERASYWINAFNLLTLKVVCDHYPVTNTDQISQFWSQDPFILGGETTAVSRVYERVTNELEDKRLPPSSIFLICRASMGYPPLTDHAITPESLETDAKVAAYKFINNDHNVFYDEEHLDFLLSPLFKRYEGIIRRSHYEPHKYAVLQMNTTNAPDLTDIMITKTYFGRIDPMLNDVALAPKKEKE